jgi:hypothetical protein
MALATLLRLLFNYELLPFLLQSRSLTGIYWPAMVAWDYRSGYRISNPDCHGCCQFTWRHQVFYWLSSLCSRCWRRQGCQSVHLSESYRCYHLLCHSDLLWWSHYDCLHAWYIREWLQQYPEPATCKCRHHFEGLVELLHLLDGMYRPLRFSKKADADQYRYNCQ